MNRTQLIKKMIAAGLDLSEIEISGAGRTLQVELPSVEAVDLFTAKVANWGGFGTQYGTSVLCASYEVDPYDYNSVSSRAHY